MPKRLTTIVLLALACVAGCVAGCSQRSCDTSNLGAFVPANARYTNWLDGRNNGSCSVASICNLLCGQGNESKASLCRSRLAGPQDSDHFPKSLNRLGIDYAQVTDGDMSFLDWASQTRRGAAFSCVVYTWNGTRWQRGHHMLCLLRLDDASATIMDVNNVTFQVIVDTKNVTAIRYTYGPALSLPIATISRAQFQKLWTGWAITTVYSPLPPLPSTH